MPRFHRGHRDLNQPAIVRALEALGFTVEDLASVGRGCPDLVASRGGVTWMIEIKNPAASPHYAKKLAPSQAAWHERWRGAIVTLTSVDDVEHWVKGMEAAMAEGKKLEVKLETTSIVNERTGEVNEPKEVIDRLRKQEMAIASMDDEIEKLAGALKAARSDRDEAVAHLRSMIRENKALPLFDGLPQEGA